MHKWAVTESSLVYSAVYLSAQPIPSLCLCLCLTYLFMVNVLHTLCLLLALCLLKRHTNILSPELSILIRLYLPLFRLLFIPYRLALLFYAYNRVRAYVRACICDADDRRRECIRLYLCLCMSSSKHTNCLIVYILSLQSTRKLILWFEMRQNEPFLWHYMRNTFMQQQIF